MSSLYNILILSFSFFFIFTSFNTSSYTQKIVVDSINKQENLNWNAYLSSATIYAVYSISTTIAPIILNLISTKTCLFLSSIGYFIYPLVFIYPFKYELEIVSIIVGFSAGILWISQNKFLATNSDERTIDRNTALFWCIYQSSMIFGNIYIFIRWNLDESIEITKNDRFEIYSILTVISLGGVIAIIFLKNSKSEQIVTLQNSTTHPISALKNCFNLISTKKMFCLCIASFYTGIEQSFYGLIYATIISQTKQFGEDSKKYIGLYGVSTGLGSVFGATVLGWLSKRYIKKNRNRIYTLGFFCHCITFIGIFCNHPNQASIEETFEKGFIEPRVYICLIIGFLLCVADASYNCQIIAFISTNYVDTSETASAFALCKFFHCCGASIAFLYSSFNLTLIIHLIILFVFGSLGTVCFYLAEKLK